MSSEHVLFYGMPPFFIMESDNIADIPQYTCVKAGSLG